MIELTRLNGNRVLVNADLIEFIETTPDCLLSMTTGRKLMVRESIEQVRELLREYRSTLRGAYPIPAGGDDLVHVDFEDEA